MFITAQFVVVPNGKYPNPINKRKDKLTKERITTVEHYIAMGMNNDKYT